MSRSGAAGMIVFAVIVTGLGVMEIIVGAMERAPSGWAYVAGAGYIGGGWFAARSLRRMTWADDAGLRLRGMFRTRVIPVEPRPVHPGPPGRQVVDRPGRARGRHGHAARH